MVVFEWPIQCRMRRGWRKTAYWNVVLHFVDFVVFGAKPIIHLTMFAMVPASMSSCVIIYVGLQVNSAPTSHGSGMSLAQYVAKLPDNLGEHPYI